jgi:3-oxoacyl-[acyl-carrier protein] reductase
LTALITGGARGIGEACARALREDGMTVYIGYNESAPQARALERELGIRAVRADVRDTAAVEEMLLLTGGADVLVCNAGIAARGLLTDMTDDEWRDVLDTNIGGVIRCCRAAIPYMVRKKSGCIVAVSSVWGSAGASCEAVYAASKAAVAGLSKSLAKELGPSGIRVNCVAPGVVDTDMNAALSGSDMDELCRRTPLGRTGSPGDVASAVRFLASDAARFITGQIIGVDGGFPF